MFTIDLANAVFIGCLAIGGILLLLVVVLDDVLGGLLDAFDFDLDFGGVSIMPVALGFTAMFGAGGLIGTEAFGLSAGVSSLIGLACGLLGAGVVFGTFTFLHRAEAEQPFTLADLIGRTGRVSVGIAANRVGAGIFSAHGLTQSLSITAVHDIPANTLVKVVDVAGTTLIVEPMADASKE